MALDDRQIERYSRQIIAAGFGGAAQERLLGARLALIASRGDVEPALAYMAGAGVGHITLITGTDAASWASRIRDLNSDVDFTLADRPPNDRDPLLALVADAAARAALAAAWTVPRSGLAIIARLDAPARIAIIPSGAGCPRCLGEGLLDPPRARAEHADFVAMVAALETLKPLAGIATVDGAGVVIDFDGVAASMRSLTASDRRGAVACGCPRVAQGTPASR